MLFTEQYNMPVVRSNGAAWTPPVTFEAGIPAMLGVTVRDHPKEVMMMNNRNLIIGAVVVVVVIAGYFLMTAYDSTPPQQTPAAKTEPKK